MRKKFFTLLMPVIAGGFLLVGSVNAMTYTVQGDSTRIAIPINITGTTIKWCENCDEVILSMVNSGCKIMDTDEFDNALVCEYAYDEQGPHTVVYDGKNKDFDSFSLSNGNVVDIVNFSDFGFVDNLYLNNNKLTYIDLMPLGYIEILPINIQLENNQLTGINNISHFQSVNETRNLTKINLSKNQFVTIPDEIESVVFEDGNNYYYLKLDDNNIIGNGLNDSRVIDLSNNPIAYINIEDSDINPPNYYFKWFGYSGNLSNINYYYKIENSNVGVIYESQTNNTEVTINKTLDPGSYVFTVYLGNKLSKHKSRRFFNVAPSTYDSPSQEGPYDDEDFYLKKANINIRGLSGSIPLEAAHPGNTQSSHPSLDGILETTDIQNFTQNWYDLDLFLVDGEGNVGHHTIMDRNMGASEVYNKKFGLGNINTGSFGYRYQWGNNYGFKPCYTNGCSDFSENSDGVVVPYYLREYTYNEDWRNPLPYFAHNVWDDGYTIVDSVADYDLGTPPLSTRLQQLENLRGGIGDTYDGEGNYGEGNGTIVHNNTTRKRSRKGPCPDGYHVPSMNEWDKILVGWGYAKNKQIDIGDYYGTSIWGNNEGKNFASDLLLPPTGYRRAQGYVGEQQGDIGEYRSSSPEEGGIAMKVPIGFPAISARGLEFDSTSIYEHSREVSHSSDEGKSVRCIKDSPDSELNVYPNGGTNTFISIYKGEIITLGTPKRAGYTFEGWYRNEDFTGEKVKVGDSIGWRIESSNGSFTSIPHLDIYAKRKAEPKCTDLPANATANNSKAPSIDTKYYYSTNTSLTCTFQCNPNYTWNSTTSKCVPNGCQGTLPANATLWNPSIVPSNNTTSYSYSATSTTEACKFKCNTNYTWNSSTSSCKAVPQSHTLTINYFFSNGSIASNSVTKQLFSGDSYNITSPIISNYTADIGIVSGIMPNSDKTITVTYTKNTSSGVGGGSSSSYNSNYYLDVYAYPSSPDTYDWVRLTIETDDDYTGKISFSKFQYRSSSSSSWSNISRTSSTYVSDYSDEWSDGYYKMSSSDDGEAVLKNLIKFKKSGYYRIYVKDTDGNEDYVQINVDASSSSSSSNDNLEAYVSPSSPDVYDWVKLTIETDDNYAGKINFSKFQYRSSSSSSWSNISRTSSTYLSDYSSEWSDGYYKMTSSDDGEVVLKNFVKFKKSGYYRIYIEDADDNETYVQINVGDDSGNNSESNSNSDLSLSASDSYPYTNKPISLTIKTEGDYSGKIKLYAKYRDSSGSRTKITNTSSTYFSDYSNIWENGYYNMKSSDKGKKTLNDLIEFKKEGAYRIYAEDEQGYSNYISVNVASSSNAKSSNDSANQVKTSNTDTGDDIDKLISQLLGNDSGVSSDINNDIERNKNNLKGVSDEIYKSRSCKEYRIQYNVDLGVFTSPDLKKKEFFINKEYLKRYIDSKNPQKDGCPMNSGRITTVYRDKSSNYGHYISPNGKVYFISFENGYYFSDNLFIQKKFSTISEIKYYIRDRNPLIGMQ